MMDRLAQAHEPEGAGLDDARVDRAHGLVDVLARACRSGTLHHSKMAPEAEGGQGWSVIFRPNCSELALEALRGGKVPAQRMVAVLQRRRPADGLERAALVLQHGGQQRAGGVGFAAEERDEPQVPLERGADLVGPVPRFHNGQVGGLHPEDRQRAHGPPKDAATLRNSALIGAGR